MPNSPTKTTKTGHLHVEEWIRVLKAGSMAKINKALANGQPIHPSVPVTLSTRGGKLSPLAFIHAWDWSRKHDACMQALHGLIRAGADPNLPDHLGRRPLHLALWMGPIYEIGDDAIKVLLDAGADPALESATSPGKSHMTALGVCVLHLDMMGLGRRWMEMLIEHDPRAVEVARRDRSTLETFAWNCRGMDDKSCREVCRLLLDHGDKLDEAASKDVPRRVQGFIQEWEVEQRALGEQDKMRRETPLPKAPGPGSRRI